MGEEIALENGRISNFHGLVTLDRVILHTVMHHSSTSTYIPNYIKIEETFCGRTDIWEPRMWLGRLGGVDLKMELITTTILPDNYRHARTLTTLLQMGSTTFCRDQQNRWRIEVIGDMVTMRKTNSSSIERQQNAVNVFTQTTNFLWDDEFWRVHHVVGGDHQASLDTCWHSEQHLQ